MADPRLSIRAADRVLDIVRRSYELERMRTVALMQAAAIEEQERVVGDGMLDETLEVIVERAKLRDERLACLREARHHEKALMALKWELDEMDEAQDAA